VIGGGYFAKLELILKIIAELDLLRSLPLAPQQSCRPNSTPHRVWPTNME